MKTAMWLALAGLVTSAPLAAQLVPQTLSSPPSYMGVYDLRTGTLSMSDDAQAADGGPVQAFVYDNSVTNGSFFGPGAGIVNMDWGTFASGGLDKVVAMRIGYATSIVAPTPVNIRIRIHQGATGSGNAGTVVLDVTLNNLPNSVTGTPQGFLIDVDLLGAALDFVLPDGPLGYSYEMFNPNTGPLLVGPPNEAGVTNLIDQYNTALTYLGSGNFGGAPFASFVMRITGEGDPLPTAFEEYGEPSAPAVTLEGEGSGKPAEDVTLSLRGFFNQTTTLVVGLQQTDIFGQPGLTYYTIPWVLIFPGLPLGNNPSLFELTATIPASAPPGAEIFFQHFTPNAFGTLQNSNGLKLTIQTP